MTGIRRVSQLGTTGESTYVDGSIQGVDIAGSIALTGVPTAPTAADGTNTTQLATTAFVTTAALGVTGGFRNVLINGAFDIWQRGTTFAPTAGTRTFVADRWYVFPSGGNLASVIRTTGVAGVLGTYSAYSLFFVGNTNVTTCLLGQRIEAANMPSLRRTVTFSARIYNITGTSFAPNLILSTPNAEDNFTSVTQRSTSTLQSCASGGWTTVTWTYDISGYTNIAYGLQVEIEIPSGSLNSPSKFLGITEVQLEKGSVATPFARRSVGEELALCQRYYWRTYGSSTLSDLFGSGIPNNTTTAYIGVTHPVEMRTAATSLDFNAQVTDLNNDWNTTGSSIYSGNKRSTTVRVTEGAYFTAFRPIFVNLNTTSRYIGLSAEL